MPRFNYTVNNHEELAQRETPERRISGGMLRRFGASRRNRGAEQDGLRLDTDRRRTLPNRPRDYAQDAPSDERDRLHTHSKTSVE